MIMLIIAVSILLTVQNGVCQDEVKLEIQLPKKIYYVNEVMQFELALRCMNLEKDCILDNKIVERLNSDIPIHFYNLKKLEINKGILSTGKAYPMGESVILLPNTCSLTCSKTVDLSRLALPPGEYEFKITLPAYHVSKKIRQRLLKENKGLPYSETITGSVNLKIVKANALKKQLYQTEMVTFTVNDEVLEIKGRDNCSIKQVVFEGTSKKQEPFDIPLHLLANETIIRVDLICIDSDTIMPINEYCIRFFKVILENNRIDSIGSVGAEEILHLKDKDDG